jgi:uncharacterized membrane protein
MGGFSTGMILLIIGILLLVLALVLTIVTGRSYRRKERELKDRIWNEYR